MTTTTIPMDIGVTEDTECLTPTGWVKFYYLNNGSQIVSYDLKTKSFQWERITQFSFSKCDDTAYRINSPTTEQVVCAAHRCIVQSMGGTDVASSAARLASCEYVPIVINQLDLFENIPPIDTLAFLPASPYVSYTKAHVGQVHYTGTMWTCRVPCGAFLARRQGRIFITGSL